MNCFSVQRRAPASTPWKPFTSCGSTFGFPWRERCAFFGVSSSVAPTRTFLLLHPMGASTSVISSNEQEQRTKGGARSTMCCHQSPLLST